MDFDLLWVGEGRKHGKPLGNVKFVVCASVRNGHVRGAREGGRQGKCAGDGTASVRDSSACFPELCLFWCLDVYHIYATLKLVSIF